MKNKLILLFTVIFAVSILSSCGIGMEINDRSFVQIIGLEKSFGKYNLSLQIYESSSSNANPDVSKSNTKVIKSSGDSFFSALTSAENKAGKDLFLPHTKLIVLGKGLENIAGTINIFLGENISPSCPIVYSDKPEKIISTEITSGIFTADTISKIIQNKIKNGEIIYSSLAKSAENQSIFKSEVAIPIMESYKNEVSFKGYKIISDGKFSSSVPEGKILETKILSNDLKDAEKIIVPLKIKKSAVSVEIFVDSNRNAKIYDNVLNYNFDCKISAKIIENPDGISPQEIETALEENLSEDLIECYNSVANKGGFDIFDIEKLVRKYNNENYNFYKSNKDELIKNSVLNLKIDCTINNKQAHFRL